MSALIIKPSKIKISNFGEIFNKIVYCKNNISNCYLYWASNNYFSAITIPRFELYILSQNLDLVSFPYLTLDLYFLSETIA